MAESSHTYLSIAQRQKISKYDFAKGKKRLSDLFWTIFGANDGDNFFGRLAAVILQPLFDNGIEAAAEKCEMIFNMLVTVKICSQRKIIADDLGIVETKFEIGLVEQLILFDVLKKL